MLIHIVIRGDTVELIARIYSVSVQRVISDNGLVYPYTLVIGQALIITQPADIYEVKAGDTLFSIATAHEMTVQELYQNNPELTYGDPLYVGQILTLKFWGEKTPTPIHVKGYAYPFIEQHLLYRALPFLTYLAIFSYGFRPDGSLIAPDDDALIAAARTYQVQPLMVFSSLDDAGNFDAELVHTLLHDPQLQDVLLDNLIGTMLDKGYRGLDSDLEYIDGDDAQLYVELLEKARDRLHAHGLTLSVALAPKQSDHQLGTLYEGHDYARIGSTADWVLLMTYEWGYSLGPPMAVAPVPQVRGVLDYATTVIPREKILLGIPNYGYDWPLPYVAGSTQAPSIGNLEATQLALSTGAVIEYDPVARAPHFSYTREGVEHVVWFEDIRSIRAKYELVDIYGLLGAGYWTIMRPFPQNWAYLSTRYHIKKLL